uniref:tRNA:m(4)X modification enzyme TRM13 n=1 Tax=Ditylenchus dipsaci TaxID=166011 RepID=A0A915CS07_9BILA
MKLTAVMPQKRRSKVSIDQLLADDINGKSKNKLLNVEQLLRSDARGLSKQEINFTKCEEPLNARALVDSEKVVVLEPEVSTGIDCFVGASSGMLKTINLTSSKTTNVLPDAEVLVCQINRELKLFNALTGTYSKLFDVVGGSGIVKGVQVTQNTNIVTAVESGELRVWNSAGEIISSDSMSAGVNLLTMRIAPTKDIVATGGRENPLKLWDLNSEKLTFTARNVRQDNLELRVPIWVTNTRFLNDGRHIVTTTGKHQIRLYDPRAQRKPVKEFEWLDEPIQALSTCCREDFVLVGNNRGELGLFDLRTKISLASKYKGFAGAIRSIDAHPTEPIFASCGIDRFVVLHDLNTRRVLKKIYCKVQLNSILLSRNMSLINSQIKKEEEDDEEDN